MEWLDRGIQGIIDQFAYPCYIVQQDFNITCTCMHYSKQADPACTKCLGTGHKIYIRQVQVYSEDIKQSVRQSYTSEPIMSTEYYVRSKYSVARQNIFVELEEAYMVHDLEELKSADRRYVYQLCYTYPKKTNGQVFIKNFNTLIKGAPL